MLSKEKKVQPTSKSGNDAKPIVSGSLPSRELIEILNTQEIRSKIEKDAEKYAINFWKEVRGVPDVELSSISDAINATKIAYIACGESLLPLIEEKDNRIATLEKKVEELQKDDWISVEDRLPDIINVIAYTDGLKLTLTYIEGSYYTPDGNLWKNDVTHWMPLPKSPSK